MSTAIETLALAKRFGRTTAVAGLTIDVRRGEAFGFLGPNGAGKTTALKMLLGLIKPSSGAAEVLGAPLGDRETRRLIGYLPELFRYQDWLSAAEVLHFHARLLGMSRSRRRAQIEAVVATVGLQERARDRVGTFSKGMQQRLGLAVALLGDPVLVFLDEPTSALDPVGRHDVRAIVQRLKERGATVFLNSHLLTEVERVCDRVAVIDRGRAIAQGSIAEMLGEAAHLRLRLEDVNATALSALGAFGTVACAAPWYSVSGASEGDVPEIVARLVGCGVRVYAVEAVKATLEERFLAMLQPDVRADDRFADPA